MNDFTHNPSDLAEAPSQAMREIKFRQPLFDNGKFKNWHYWGFISEGKFVGVAIGDKTIQEAKKTSQQFTGLYDKNGKDIFEGDILSNGYGKALIVFEHGKFGLKFDDGYLRAIKSRPDFEIIGSIYENPELLK